MNPVLPIRYCLDCKAPWDQAVCSIASTRCECRMDPENTTMHRMLYRLLKSYNVCYMSLRNKALHNIWCG